MENQTELSNIELSQESNANTQNTQETLNSEPEIAEEVRIPEPWESVPEGLVYCSALPAYCRYYACLGNV